MSNVFNGSATCCGVAELGDVSGDGDIVRDAVSRRLAFSRNGLILYFSVSSFCDQAVKDAGFTELGKFKNPNTGNIVTIWGFARDGWEK